MTLKIIPSRKDTAVKMADSAASAKALAANNKINDEKQKLLQQVQAFVQANSAEKLLAANKALQTTTQQKGLTQSVPVVLTQGQLVQKRTYKARLGTARTGIAQAVEPYLQTEQEATNVQLDNANAAVAAQVSK